MFRLKMLPAREGDCLWIEYGEPKKPLRILVDTGTPENFKALANRILSLPQDQQRFELFVITHIDSDHIGSATRLLEEPPSELTFGDVWFNGYRHLLAATDRLGARQAQELTVALERGEQPWNKAFGSGPVMVADHGRLPRIELDGGLVL